MANKHRGEIEYEAGDLKFTARPTLAIIAALEAEFGPILGLAARSRSTSTFAVSDACKFVQLVAKGSGVKGSGIDAGNGESAAPEAEAFRERVFENGPMTALAFATMFMTSAITTGQPEKNVKRGTTKN